MGHGRVATKQTISTVFWTAWHLVRISVNTIDIFGLIASAIIRAIHPVPTTISSLHNYGANVVCFVSIVSNLITQGIDTNQVGSHMIYCLCLKLNDTRDRHKQTTGLLGAMTEVKAGIILRLRRVYTGDMSHKERSV